MLRDSDILTGAHTHTHTNRERGYGDVTIVYKD